MGKRRYRSWSTMKDSELIVYVFKEYGSGVARSELEKKDKSLYDTLANRKLLDRFHMKTRNSSKFFNLISDDILVEFALNKYGGIGRCGLQKKDNRLYKELWKRKLLDKIDPNSVQQHKKPVDYWKNIDNAIVEAQEAMEVNDWESLPSHEKLFTSGYGMLSQAIVRYHGGFLKFREALYERLGIQCDTNNLEIMVKDYIGGQDG